MYNNYENSIARASESLLGQDYQDCVSLSGDHEGYEDNLNQQIF